MDVSMRLHNFYDRLNEIYLLSGIRGLLEWDQQVCMPEAGAAGRAKQQELLSRLVHQRFTEPSFISLVRELASDASQFPEDDQINLREIHRQLERLTKLPEEFVAEKARLSALTYAAWTKAKPAGDFSAVSGLLAKLIDLARRETDLVGYAENPYDALLDEYEPHATLSTIKPLILDLAEQLAQMIPSISSDNTPVAAPRGVFPEVKQHYLCRRVLSAIGYDFSSGRLDSTAHPFQASLGENDFRVTTRYDETNPLQAIFTALHECGHALYEANLPARWRGTPRGSVASLGIHESQSRLWENFVGRSREFCAFLTPLLREAFPSECGNLGSEELYKRMNRVQPSLIRIEADEVTYSLHVAIRLLLEERLVNGSLEVSDLPAAWNEMYRHYLGIVPANDSEGVLQDVHWYSGMIGYFPTYVLGNVFAAMLHTELHNDLGSLSAHIESGNFNPIGEWLKHNIHEQGMSYSSFALIERVCRRPVDTQAYIQYVRLKFRP